MKRATLAALCAVAVLLAGCGSTGTQACYRPGEACKSAAIADDAANVPPPLPTDEPTPLPAPPTQEPVLASIAEAQRPAQRIVQDGSDRRRQQAIELALASGGVFIFFFGVIGAIAASASRARRNS